MPRLYYTPPSDEIFEEVKTKSIEVWSEKNSHPSYIDEKVDKIKSMENIEDNVMYIVAMFDEENMKLLADKLSTEAKTAIRGRMINGGCPDYLIPF